MVISSVQNMTFFPLLLNNPDDFKGDPCFT